MTAASSIPPHVFLSESSIAVVKHYWIKKGQKRSQPLDEFLTTEGRKSELRRIEQQRTREAGAKKEGAKLPSYSLSFWSLKRTKTEAEEEAEDVLNITHTIQ